RSAAGVGRALAARGTGPGRLAPDPRGGGRAPGIADGRLPAARAGAADPAAGAGRRRGSAWRATTGAVAPAPAPGGPGRPPAPVRAGLAERAAAAAGRAARPRRAGRQALAEGR